MHHLLASRETLSGSKPIVAHRRCLTSGLQERYPKLIGGFAENTIGQPCRFCMHEYVGHAFGEHDLYTGQGSGQSKPVRTGICALKNTSRAFC